MALDMVNDLSDSERKPAAATWATLSDYQQRFFYMHHPTDRIAHITAFVTIQAESYKTFLEPAMSR